MGCDDQGGGNSTSLLNLANVAAGTYAVVVGNWSSFTTGGPYVLNVSGTIASGGDCTGVLAQAGDIACGAGYACIAGVCTGNLACNNAMDDDGDGDTDYPNDPGCSSPTDNDETDDCPSGPMCPACSNTIDDDMDGQTDYPIDTDCSAAGGTAEVCGVETDPVILMTTPSISGANINDTSNFKLSCDFTTGVAGDRVALVTLPAMTSFHIDTLGSNFNTVIALKDPSCGPATISCNNSFTIGGDVINTGPLTAGNYAILVDGYNNLTGNYTVNVSGKIANNASCESPLAVAGALDVQRRVRLQGHAGDAGPASPPSATTPSITDGDTEDLTSRTDPGCTDLSRRLRDGHVPERARLPGVRQRDGRRR